MNDFFANWYELLGSFEGFSDDMFYNSLYLPIGLCMVLIPIVFLTLYYYVLNSAKYNRWWHWLLLVVVLCVVNFGISYLVSYRNIMNIYIDMNSEPSYTLGTYCFSFSLINLLWCFVVSFIWSLIIKWGSNNCRRTPF